MDLISAVVSVLLGAGVAVPDAAGKKSTAVAVVVLVEDYFDGFLGHSSGDKSQDAGAVAGLRLAHLGAPILCCYVLVPVAFHSQCVETLLAAAVGRP